MKHVCVECYNMATEGNFEVISVKFSMLLICTSGNYVQKYISYLYIY
jgi:hypothetical protein